MGPNAVTSLRVWTQVRFSVQGGHPGVGIGDGGAELEVSGGADGFVGGDDEAAVLDGGAVAVELGAGNRLGATHAEQVKVRAGQDQLGRVAADAAAGIDAPAAVLPVARGRQAGAAIALDALAFDRGAPAPDVLAKQPGDEGDEDDDVEDDRERNPARYQQPARHASW